MVINRRSKYMKWSNDVNNLMIMKYPEISSTKHTRQPFATGSLRGASLGSPAHCQMDSFMPYCFEFNYSMDSFMSYCFEFNYSII